MSDQHPLDRLVDAIRQDIRRKVTVSRQALAGPVPVGTRPATPQQDFRNYLSLSPAAKGLFAQQYGPQAMSEYETAMLGHAYKQIGPAALVLADYIKPYLQNPYAQLEVP